MDLKTCICTCVCECVCVPGVCYLGYYGTESWTPNRAIGCSGEKVETAEQVTLFIRNSHANLNTRPDPGYHRKIRFPALSRL